MYSGITKIYCGKTIGHISVTSQSIAPYFIIQSLKYYKTHIEL